jgi:hypothetical protein
MDDHHKGCRVHYRNYWEPEKIEECDCECHVGKKKPPLPDPHTPPKEEKVSRRRKSK